MNPALGNAVERTYATNIPYVAGSNPTFALTNNELVETLQLTLSGTLTNTGYTTAPVKRVEGIENLIRKVNITGNSRGSGRQSDTFTDVDFAFLAYQTRILETTAPARTDVGTANAIYNFATTANKYFGFKRLGGNYALGFLDSRYLNSFNLGIQFRDLSAVIDPGTGVAGTSALSNVALQVHSIHWEGGPLGVRAFYQKQSQRQFDLTNLSSLNVPFANAPVGNFLQRQTFKTTVGDADYADPSDAVLATSLQAQGAFLQVRQNDNFNSFQASISALKSKMKLDYSLESVPVGYTTAELSRTHTFADLLDARNLRSGGLANKLDLTTVAGSINTLQITDEQIVYRKA